MNAIGDLGTLITKYQYPIEIVLLSILGAIVVGLIINGIVKSHKRKSLLRDIDETTRGIESAVGDIMVGQKEILDEIEREKETELESSEEIKEGCSENKRDNLRSRTLLIKKCDKPGWSDSNEESIDDAEEVESESVPEDESGIGIIDRAVEADTPGEIAGLAKLINCDDGYGFDWKEEKESFNAKRGRDNPTESDVLEEISENRIPRKYDSRDCNVDKYGKVYTEKALKEQIQ